MSIEQPLFSKDGKPEFSYKKCNTVEELSQYLKELIEYKHDYNTSGYAITKALLATEMMIAHQLGTSGFQHGYANISYITETRGSKTGCAIINFDDLMYPQYDVISKVKGWIDEHKKSEYFIKEVKCKIKEDDESGFKAHPNVRDHWEKLVNDFNKQNSATVETNGCVEK